ncbi:MAG TPA: HEAT repeat domain-containing protein [bacterium]|nr:HEAT repeat domain-containing protein [bacterium]
MISTTLISFWDDPLYRFLSLIIALELVLIVVQVGWLLVQTSIRKYRLYRLKRFHASMKAPFFTALDDPLTREAWMVKARKFSEPVLRMFLEPYLTATKGEYQAKILALYRDLGLARQDLYALRSSFWHKRVLALRRLQNVASPEEKFVLAKMKKDVHTVRILTAQIMSRIGNEKDVFNLLKDLHLHNRLMEQPMFTMLSSMEREKFDNLMERWDQFECRLLKRIMLIVAAGNSPKTANKWLARAAADQDIDVRIGAAIAAGKLNTYESLTTLLELLQDGIWEVRAQAAKALGIRQEDSTIESLALFLRDPHYWVRQNAAAALSNLGDPGRKRLREIADTASDTFAVDAATQELERYQLTITAEGVQS